MKILNDYQSKEVKLTQKRITYHHKLIILLDIVNDVKKFSHLKDTGNSKSGYEQKLALISQRRNMIDFVNNKYKANSKLFLEIFELYKHSAGDIIDKPTNKVK